MINRLIHDILSKDDTDEDQATFEAEHAERFPSITDFSNFTQWKSLKTLLGDTSSEWADNKIHDRQEKDQYLQETYKDQDLPIIAVSQTGSFNPVDKSYFNFSGEICLYIATPLASNNTLEASRIWQRIKRILFVYKSVTKTTLDTYCKEFPDYGIQQVQIRLNRVAEYYSRSLKVFLGVTFQEI